MGFVIAEWSWISRCVMVLISYDIHCLCISVMLLLLSLFLGLIISVTYIYFLLKVVRYPTDFS